MYVELNRFLIIYILLFCACKTPDIAVVTPKPSQPEVIKKDTVIQQQEVKQEKPEHFRVLLLLNVDAATYFKKDTADNYLYPEMDPHHLSALQFYEGWKKADAESKGYIVSTYIDADSATALQLLKNSATGQYDLVIAMLNGSLNATASVYAAEKKNPLLIPYNSTSALLIGNKECWLALPSNKSQCRQMATFIRNNNRAAIFRVVYREASKNEKELASLFYNELIASGLDTASCRLIRYQPEEWKNPEGFLEEAKKNILFLPTSDESFLSSFLVKLDIQEKYDVSIAGLPTWENFSSVDPALLERFDAHIFSSTYLDYENEIVKQFRKNFVEQMHFDPLFSAYAGYDVYNWIEQNSMLGNKIDSFLSTSSLESPATGFEFRRICDDCGFENQYISVLRYREGLLEKVNR